MSKIIKKQDGESQGEFKKTALEMPEGSIVSKKMILSKDKADQMLETARQEANHILKKAEERLSEVEKIRQNAYEEGLSVGKEEGLQTVTEKVLELKLLKDKFCADAENDIIKLVMSVAEKVIGVTVQKHPEVIADVTKQALEHVIGDRIVVRVNPADYQTIVSQNLDIRDELDRTKRLVFKEDENISQGGCVVDTEVGTIDAQLETQLAAIRKALGL